jgi:6-phosphogluconolactonase
MMNLIEYPDRDMMMLHLADRLNSELADQIKQNGRATLCVPGGTTPGPIFDILSEQNLDWAQISVILNDERWVPETHDRSNTRLLKERLLVSKASVANYVSLYADAPTPAAASDLISARLKDHLPISVLLLGMGADMHTASLFPTAPNIHAALASDAPAVMQMDPDNQPEARITLTARSLKTAMNTHILITGDEKRAAIESAAYLPEPQAPIRAFLNGATIHWAP